MSGYSKERRNKVINSIKTQPGLTARDYERITGTASTGIIKICKRYAPNLLSEGKVAVHPDEDFRPNWYFELTDSQQAKVPLKKSGKPQQYIPVKSAAGNTVIEAAHAVREGLKAKLLHTYSITHRRRRHILNLISALDAEIDNEIKTHEAQAARTHTPNHRGLRRENEGAQHAVL